MNWMDAVDRWGVVAAPTSLSGLYKFAWRKSAARATTRARTQSLAATTTDQRTCAARSASRPGPAANVRDVRGLRASDPGSNVHRSGSMWSSKTLTTPAGE